MLNITPIKMMSDYFEDKFHSKTGLIQMQLVISILFLIYTSIGSDLWEIVYFVRFFYWVEF